MDLVLYARLMKAIHEQSEALRMASVKNITGSEVKKFSKLEVDVYTSRMRDKVYAIFQGSRSARDWITNLDFFPVKRHFGSWTFKVHTGFWNIATQTQDEFFVWLEEQYPGIQPVFVGYSNGGAMAALYALHDHTHSDLELTLFGMPCIGDAELSKAIEGRVGSVCRVQNTADIVSYLNCWPPNSCLGDLIYITSGNDIKVNPKKSVVRKDVLSSIWRVDDKNPFSSHLPPMYLDSILQAVAKEELDLSHDEGAS